MPQSRRVRLAPSILSADAAELGRQVEEAAAAGVDAIHVDVMDGLFVPNISYGPLVVEALRRRTTLPLDVHMMVREPGHLLSAFAAAGATSITVHAEACAHLHRVVRQVKETGAMAGVAINPGTPIVALEEVLPDLDLVLVMTVDPGFPAQALVPSALGKVERLRRLLDVRGFPAELEVDGGISAETAPAAVAAGATVLVAGSAVFNPRASVAESVRRIRESIASAGR